MIACIAVFISPTDYHEFSLIFLSTEFRQDFTDFVRATLVPIRMASAGEATRQSV